MIELIIYNIDIGLHSTLTKKCCVMLNHIVLKSSLYMKYSWQNKEYFFCHFHLKEDKPEQYYSKTNHILIHPWKSSSIN